jgi:hypothetical protein
MLSGMGLKVLSAELNEYNNLKSNCIASRRRQQTWEIVLRTFSLFSHTAAMLETSSPSGPM